MAGGCFYQTVALNICDIVHVNDELIVATRDGRVLVYQQDPADLDKVCACVSAFLFS